MSDATQVFRGDGEQWFNTMARMHDQFEKLVQQSSDLTKMNKEAVKELKNAAKGIGEQNEELSESETRLEGMVTQVLAYSAGLLGVQSIQKAITEEMENQKRLQDEARQEQITVAGAQANLLINLGAPSKEAASAYLEKVDSLAKAAKVGDVRDVYAAVSTGLSVSGGEPERALQATTSALRIGKSRPEDLDTLVGGLLGIQKAAPDMTSDQAMAFMLSIGNVSNIKDTSKIAINAPGVLSAAVASARAGSASTEDLLKQGGALFAYLGKEGTDITGESSRTQGIKTITGLRDFFAGRANDPGNLAGWIQSLQSNEAMRREFLGSEHFNSEAQFKIPLEELLSGKKAGVFSGMRSRLSTDEDQISSLEKQLASATPELQAADSERAVEGIKQRRRREALTLGRTAQARNFMQEIYDARSSMDAALGWGQNAESTHNIVLSGEDAVTARSNEAQLSAEVFKRKSWQAQATDEQKKLAEAVIDAANELKILAARVRADSAAADAANPK